MKKYFLILILISILFILGCVSKVFNEPVALSTKSIVAKHTEPIEKISTEYTNALFILIPIPSDPRNAYDDLLKRSKEKGGNGVIDVQLHSKNFFMWLFPGIIVDTWELYGTSVRVE